MNIFFRYFLLLGASACVELDRFQEAITWCDKGLAVCFITSCQQLTDTIKGMLVDDFFFVSALITEHLFIKKSFYKKARYN